MARDTDQPTTAPDRAREAETPAAPHALLCPRCATPLTAVNLTASGGEHGRAQWLYTCVHCRRSAVLSTFRL